MTITKTILNYRNTISVHKTKPMYLYYPTDVLNMIIKYTPKELVKYLKDKDYNWPKLYYELFGTKEINIRYNHPKKYKNLYRNAIINRINKRSDIVTYGNNFVFRTTGYGKLLVKGCSHDGQMGIGKNFNIIYRSWLPVKLKHRVLQVACEWNHSMILLDNGTVLGTGNNSAGQLGLGDHKNRYVWERAKIEEKILQVACGNSYSVTLTKSGTVYISGRLPLYDYKSSPNILKETTSNIFEEAININETVIQIASGSNHLMILFKTGVLLAYGSNFFCQFGSNNMESEKLPYITFPQKIIQVQCGPLHSMILLEDGIVMATGNNEFGQLGSKLTHHPSSKTVNRFEAIKVKNILQIECKLNYSILYLKNGHKLRTDRCGKWITMNGPEYPEF